MFACISVSAWDTLSVILPIASVFSSTLNATSPTFTSTEAFISLTVELRVSLFTKFVAISWVCFLIVCAIQLFWSSR